MADVSAIAQKAITDIVNVIKGLIVLFVFANILFGIEWFDPINGIIELVKQFLTADLAGLLTLLVFVSFLGD